MLSSNDGGPDKTRPSKVSGHVQSINEQGKKNMNGKNHIKQENAMKVETYTCRAIEFELGAVVMSAGVRALIGNLPHQLLEPCLLRHKNGDWGNVCQEDKEANDDATRQGFRVMSEYRFSGERIWLITEADRSVTTFLLPSEY